MVQQTLNQVTAGKKNARLGGRSARIAVRSAPKPSINPCAPGQIGGQYLPLNQVELCKIVDAAFQILAEIGMGQAPEPFKTLALKKGAGLKGDGRLTFSRSMMEDIIEGAAKSFVFYGRDQGNCSFSNGFW